MYDLNKIQKVITDIEGYLKQVGEFNISSLSELDDPKNFFSSSMLLFSIVNRVMDLGEEIIISRNLGTPSTYKDIFSLLYENRIIDKNLYERFSYLVYVRNMIAHEYYRFGKKEIYNAIKELPIIGEFVLKVKSLVAEEK